MRHFLVFLCACILSACATAPKPATLRPQAIQTNTPADSLAATVIVLAAKRDTGVCAGTFVHDGVLTAAHCIPPATGCARGDVAACLGSRPRFVAWGSFAEDNDDIAIEYGRTVAIDFDADLAFVRLDKPTHVGVPLGADATPGQRVYSVGHPDGQWFTIADGYVTIAHDDFTRVAIAIWGGSSGGGLFDRHGRLIGVASKMSVPDGRAYSAAAFFVSPSAVLDFLSALPSAQ
jgi:hypothetical protein